MRLRNTVYVNVIDGTEYEMLWAVDIDKKTFASGSGLLQLAYFKFSFFQVSTNHHYFLSLSYHEYLVALNNQEHCVYNFLKYEKLGRMSRSRALHDSFLAI